MEQLGFFNINRPDVVHETIDGETVIVNLENGIYYSLRKSGVDVWNLIETGANFEELISLILDRYDGSPEEIRNAINELLVVLQREGLVQVSTTKRTISQAPQPLTGGEKVKFEAPILEKYSDMQELLLLDPIHEVDEDGWPHKAQEDGASNAGQG
jgi:hypothetical protein